MKYKLIKELYDCFYTPPELSAPRQEIAECHKTLIEVLEKPEHRLVLQIIDAKDRIAEDTSIDSFISGFTLAWKLSAELNNCENERLASCQTGRLGARFISQKEHHKEETTWVINYGERCMIDFTNRRPILKKRKKMWSGIMRW